MHSEICICGSVDSYTHLKQREVLQEIKELKNYDIIKLLSNNQSFINPILKTKKAAKQVDLKIKKFHKKLFKKRSDFLEQNDEMLNEINLYLDNLAKTYKKMKKRKDVSDNERMNKHYREVREIDEQEILQDV